MTTRLGLARRANQPEPVKSQNQKYFALPEFRFTLFTIPSQAHLRDVSRSSRYVGHGMRWAAAASGDLHRTKTLQRTAKSCGPGAATLASIRPGCAGAATVTKKAAHRGEHEANRQTIARGKPGLSG